MMNEKSLHKAQATLLLLAAGACLHLATALFLGSGNAGFRAGLLVWSLVPYVLLALALQRSKNGIGILLGALVVVVVDASAFWSVFVTPQHSTAALNLLAAPFWNLVCVTPLAIAAEAWTTRRP